MESERGTVPPFALPAPLGRGNRLLACPVCPQGLGGWEQACSERSRAHHRGSEGGIPPSAPHKQRGEVFSSPVIRLSEPLAGWLARWRLPAP